MPSLTVREYHPESGALFGNISVLDFGKITLGTHSRVKVLDIAFSDVSEVGNVKLGLISSGGVTVKSGNIGRFGIMSSTEFNSTISSTPVTIHFDGINSTGTASDANNIVIGNRDTTLSNYFYLDIEIGSTNLSAGNGAYKIFFDYA